MMNVGKNVHKLYALMTAAFLMIFTGGIYCPAAESAPAVVLEDNAALLDEEENAWLMEEAQAVAEKSGFNMILGTCDDAEGKTVREICDVYFDAYTLGDDGVCCIIDMDNREISFRAYGDAILYLPQEEIDDILDTAYNYVAEGAYADCLYEMVSGTDAGFANGIPDGMRIYDEDTGKEYIYDASTGEVSEVPPLEAIEVVFAFIIALIVGLIVYFAIIGKYKLKWGTYRYDFHDSGNLKLTKEEDRFINQVVTRRHIPRNDGNSSGGGSSTSVSRGSSGRVSSGGSRKF
ncbi:MAG: TPM domain-containing protein [Lachnospiraceae bacterium]|nr:TPM domain-containing protein [Lachnospiraceae bacterium]